MALAIDHAITEQLGHQLDIGGLAAARASAGELEEGLQSLAVLDGGHILDALDFGHGHGELPVLFFLGLSVQRLHDQGLFLGGADLHAVAAAGAVQRADLHTVRHAGEFLAGGGLGVVAFGSVLHDFLSRHR